MAKKNQQSLVLDNGVEINTTKNGWNDEEITSNQVLMAGWQAGKSSHHPISLGFALACKGKIEGAYLGDAVVEDDNGNEIKVPVMDPLVINEAMMNASIEAYDLDVIKIRAATSRASIGKKLTALQEAISGNADVMKALEKSNPDLYEKLSGE